MRSSVLLTSAMAMGAVASPLGMLKRYIVTELDLEVKTVTVYVTPGQPIPTPEAYGVQPVEPSSSTTCLEDESSTPAPAPPASSAPAPSSQAPAPVPSSSEVYVPPVVTPTPTPTPTPSPSPEYPASSVPEPSSSAPAPTSAAPSPSSTPDYGSHQSGEGQAELTSGPEYKAAVLYHHNAARANHDAAPLVWDDLCEQNARYAAELCVFDHNFPKDSEPQGQNLFTVSGDVFNVTAGIYESWYKNEFKLMTDNGLWGAEDIGAMDIFHEVGHLTQMVWKETTKVGCASVDCSGRMRLSENDPTITEMDKYTVCNYASPGNGAGKFVENVAIPKSSVLGSWLD